MKMRMFATGFAACCAAMILAALTVSPQDPAEMQAWTDAMEKYGAPSSEHEGLAKRVGRWDAKITFWMGPGVPPETHEGTADFEMILDGRYLVQHVTMDFNGMAFEGAGLMSYDRMKDEYQSVWVDNMGTGIMWMEGTEQDGAFALSGMSPDMMAGKYIPARSSERMVNDDSILFEMFMTGQGGEDFKSMEIAYTRVED